MKFADTIHSVEKANAKTGATHVDEWIKELGKLDTPGAKGILHDLEALSKQLAADKPDAARVVKLLGSLGEATTKIADRADSSGDKLKQLGTALTEAGN